MDHLELAKHAKEKYGELSVEEADIVKKVRQLEADKEALLTRYNEISTIKASMDFVMKFSKDITKKENEDDGPKT